MKQLTPISKFLFVCVFALGAKMLFAQQAITVRMDGGRLRAPLDVPEGTTTVHLCNLTPGQQYTVIAVGAGYGQPSVFRLQPSVALTEAASDLQRAPGAEHLLHFTAPSACVDVLVNATANQALTTIPMYLSVKCESCPEDVSWLQKFADKAESAALVVSPGGSAVNLVSNVLVGGNCYEVANVTSSGNNSSRGTFSSGATNIGIESGIILSTGQVGTLDGPNLANNTSYSFGIIPIPFIDPNLATLTQGLQYDLSTIEFDFTPTASTVQFDFVFGSEEYCEYINQQFNDVFGFFISGPGIIGAKNIAVIPNSSTPVSVNNINHLDNAQFYVNNNNFPPIVFGGTNCVGIPMEAPNECSLDGWTTQFTATANVIPCSTYHIKLAIADVADAVYNSAVFLRANSFNAGGSANAAAVYPAGQMNGYEACNTGFIRIYRDSSTIATPLTVNFTVTGTATPGVDYTPLTSPVIIPAGATQVLLPIQAADDMMVEGQESIVLLLDQSCSCDQAEVTFLLRDKPAYSLDLADQSVCTGQALTLTPVVAGGVPAYSYAWSTGQTSASISVNTSGVYTVTVTDACGITLTASAVASISQAVALTENISFCPGDSVVVAGVVFTGAGTISDTLPGAGGNCDTIIHYILALRSITTLSDTISFCPGDSVTIDGTAYFGPGVVTDTLPGAGGGCDTIVTYTLQVLPQPALADTIIFCLGDSISIGGKVYTGSGIAIDTLPANGSCDTIVTYTLIGLAVPTRAETIKFCPGASVIIGGKVYTAAGIVVDTLPASGGGCDTIATYTLELLPQPVRTETIEFCPGETITIGGQPYTQAGVVLDTVPATGGGCDTLVTYTLTSRTPAPSAVTITCPNSIAVTANVPTAITYNATLAFSDCPCPGISIERSAGLASGALFPVGVNTVCYTATDSCGNSRSCCFSVTVSETKPCDIKVIGCVKFELLTITRDAAANTTYRIRVTNNCTEPLTYVGFQLPKGVVANAPLNNSIYAAPSGRDYEVRNPNASPVYSIRFAPVGPGISGGASDIFEYTLPPQTFSAYINVFAKIGLQPNVEAHLNTFYCPVGVTPSGSRFDLTDGVVDNTRISVFPNPTTGLLFADLSAWQGEQADLQVFDSRGVLLHRERLLAETAPQPVLLPAGWSAGLYFLDVRRENGERQVLRFVLDR